MSYQTNVLDKFSPSFCGAKWYNATIWLGSGMTTSCHHPLPHKIDAEAVKLNYKLLHNTPEKKLQRKQMQEGIRPSGCEYCWKIEDMKDGSVSDRTYKSNIYDNADLEIAYNTGWEEDVNLKTLEISFDRTCNFACTYCNPAFSTTWAKDINNNGPYTDLATDGRNHYTHPHNSSQLYKFGEANPYVEAFFKWWDADLHKTLNELRITGGEPLMSAETWRLFDWFVDNRGKSNTSIAVNTNLGAKKELIDKLIDVSHTVTKLDVYTSIEATEGRAEYIRDGLEYLKWFVNVDRLLRHGNTNVHVMATPSVLSIMGITKFLDMMLGFKRVYKDRISFTLNILRFPSFQSVTVLPYDMRVIAATAIDHWLEQHKDYPYLSNMEKEHTSRLANYLCTVETPHENASPRHQLALDLKLFLEQYDERRGKSLQLSCPEIAEWLNG